MLVGHGQRRLSGVRLNPGEELEEHDPGGVHVRTRISGAARHLFRREVRGGPDQQAGLGVVAAPGQHPGQAEVSDLDRMAVGQQHVLRLDIAVHQPRGMGCGQPGQHAFDDVLRFPRAQPPTVVQQVAQGLAGHVLHGQEQDAAIGALVVHADHVRMGQPGHGPGLTHEAAHEVLIVGELGMHDLQRDRAVQPGIRAQVDGCHPAASNEGLNPVTAIEDLADGCAGKRRVHIGSIVWPRGVGEAQNTGTVVG